VQDARASHCGLWLPQNAQSMMAGSGAIHRAADLEDDPTRCLQGREIQRDVPLKLPPLHTGDRPGLALDNRDPEISRDHGERGRQPRFRERNANLRILGPVAALAGTDEDFLSVDNAEARWER